MSLYVFTEPDYHDEPVWDFGSDPEDQPWERDFRKSYEEREERAE